MASELLVFFTVVAVLFVVYAVKRRKAYVYRPLTSARDIRLFMLFDGPENSAIEGSLWHRSLGDMVSDYEALSYVWGTEQQQQGGKRKKKRKIICDGAVLEISDSLYLALKALRSRSNGESRLIWADAMCINQADDGELGRQVKIMARIYRRAKTVQVWLGEPSYDSDLAMDFIVELVDQLKIMDRRKGKDVRVGFDNHQDFGLPSKDDLKWSALSRLLRRPWFTRAWVVQEVAVAKRVTVSCGRREVSWSYFNSMYELSRRFGLRLHRDVAESTGSEAQEAFGVIYNARDTVQTDTKLHLIQLLRATRCLNSKRPQDKVFALLGLAVDGTRYIHHVNYTWQSVADTFQAVAGTLVQNGDFFGMLSQVRHPQQVYGLPSWVPDWSYDEGALRSGYPFHLHPEGCRAGKGHGIGPVKLSLAGTDNSELTLPGCIIGSLKFLSDTMEYVREGPDVLEHYDELDKECRRLAHRVASYPTGESVEEAQWRTRIANLSMRITTADSSYGRSYISWRRYLRMALAQEEGEDIDERVFMRLDAESDAFATAQNSQIGGRKFAVTRDGYFGLVPGWSEVDDKICIFQEAATPFVVRPDGDGKWELVGECYLHGLMNGEALRRPSFVFRNITLV